MSDRDGVADIRGMSESWFEAAMASAEELGVEIPEKELLRYRERPYVLALKYNGMGRNREKREGKRQESRGRRLQALKAL